MSYLFYFKTNTHFNFLVPFPKPNLCVPEIPQAAGIRQEPDPDALRWDGGIPSFN